jgi:hypothetical protein
MICAPIIQIKVFMPDYFGKCPCFACPGRGRFSLKEDQNLKETGDGRKADRRRIGKGA